MSDIKAEINKEIKDFSEEKSKWINSNDTKFIIKKYIHSQNLISHILNGYNDLSNSIRNIVEHQFKIDIQPFPNERKSEENANIEKISFSVDFQNLSIKPPVDTDINTGKTSYKFPVSIRTKMTNYTAQIFISLKARFVAHLYNGQTIERIESLENYNLASLPIMVRSNLCSTGHMKNSPEQLTNVLESPDDLGGYFIMNGGEIYVINSENIKFNSPNIYFTTNPVSQERVWLELISKPGDAFENSDQMIIRLGKNKSLTVEISSETFKEVQIPFYLLFRILGITVDAELVKYIIHTNIGNSDPVIRQIQSMLESAYQVKVNSKFASIQNSYDRDKIILRIAEIINKLEENGEHINDKNKVQYLVSSTIRRFDRHFLPHIGEKEDSRISKAKFLGYLIRRLLLVDLGIGQQTDRDSYINKRVHTAGVLLAKAFKNQFNLVIVQRIKKDLKNLFSKVDFSQVRLSNVNIKKETLEKALAQVILSSQETINIGTSQLPNRVPSMHVHRKNQLNTIVSARNIESPVGISKQTTRAEDMRHVQETTAGFVCPLASKDTGEKVGMTKELTLTCTITPTQSGLSNTLKQKLLADEFVINMANVKIEEITMRRYSKLFVNGDWIGVMEKPHEVVSKYRELRRRLEIDMYTTIYWDQLIDEVYFWVDHGRLIRPLLIMDNNVLEVLAAEMAGKKPPKFYQQPRITPQHIEWLRSGHKNGKDYIIDNLIQEGIMEYITPDEQLNCFIAKDIDTAFANRNNITKIYTHVEIPQALFGISASVGILLDHNPITRSTYETNQVKQTCGWYCLGWPWRLDKNGIYQIHAEHPLCRTLVNDLLMPMGSNVNIMYGCFKGNNQEDSAIINKSATDCGLFMCAFSRFYMSKIEPGEIIRIPSHNDTINIHSRASYSKLSSDGYVYPGTVINNGDVIISKCSQIATTTSQAGMGEKFKYIDKSVVYRHNDPGVVDKLTRPSIQSKIDGTRFVAVKTISQLPVVVGDKFSTRAGNKSINAVSAWAGDMPFTATGTPITYIANPQTITTRMVVSQLIEGVIAKLCLQKCIFIEASVSTDAHMDAIRLELAKYGVQNVCYEQVYDGETGDAVDSLVVVCPGYLQRLQKFAAHEKYSNQFGPTDIISHQPTSGGRNTNGGLRFGEMEVDVMGAHGSMGLTNELLYANSDGIDIYICKKCNTRATVGIRKNIYICKKCGSAGDIVRTESSYSANLFMNEQAVMGINNNIVMSPYTYYK